MSYQTGDNTNEGLVDAATGSAQLSDQIGRLNAKEQAAARRAKEAIDDAANGAVHPVLVKASGQFNADGTGHEYLSVEIVP